MLPTFDRALNEIGINSDGVKTSKLDLSGDVTQPLNEGLSKIIQSEIEYGYKRFIGLVSEAREIPIEEVDKIAQGRVWAGSTALELGLIDNLGNLSDAIERAAQIAELDDFITFYPSQEVDWKQQLLESFSSTLKALIPEFILENIIIRESIKSLREIDKFNDPKGLYIRCENCLI
jgi:protease-4